MKWVCCDFPQSVILVTFGWEMDKMASFRVRGVLCFVMVIVLGVQVSCRESNRRPVQRPRPVYIPYIFQLLGDKGWETKTESFTGSGSVSSGSGTDTRYGITIPPRKTSHHHDWRNHQHRGRTGRLRKGKRCIWQVTLKFLWAIGFL